MKYLALLVSFLFIVSCNKGPQAINYGSKNCDFCQMTIVDNIHAAQLVTDKGKVYSFDDMSCMVHFKDGNDYQYSHEMVNFIEQPGELISVKEAFFAHSEAVETPMGGNITAFKTEAERNQFLEQNGGKAITLEEAYALLGENSGSHDSHGHHHHHNH